MHNELAELLKRIHADPEIAETHRLLHGTTSPSNSDKKEKPRDPEEVYNNAHWEDGYGEAKDPVIPGETIYTAQESSQQS